MATFQQDPPDIDELLSVLEKLMTAEDGTGVGVVELPDNVMVDLSSGGDMEQAVQVFQKWKGGSVMTEAATAKKMTDDLVQALSTLEPVKLRDATVLGQTVFGTSNAYRFVFRSPCVNIGLRAAGQNISLRVEPVGSDKFSSSIAQKLVLCGFQMKDGKYMSQHFTVEGNALAVCGAYGAVREQLTYLLGLDEAVSLSWQEIINLEK